MVVIESLRWHVYRKLGREGEASEVLSRLTDVLTALEGREDELNGIWAYLKYMEVDVKAVLP